MEGEGFGACLSRFMERNPSQHVCQSTHLAPVIDCDASQVNRWRRGDGAPKLNSTHVTAIAQHLQLSAEQAQELEAAQVNTLKQPARPPQKRPPDTSRDTTKKPQYIGARGKAVVRTSLRCSNRRLLEPIATSRPIPSR